MFKLKMGVEQPSATAKPIEVQPNQDANANKAEIGQGQAEETIMMVTLSSPQVMN